MVSERMQRRIEALLDQCDLAVDAGRWADVAEKARAVLAIDPENADAQGFLKMAGANGVSSDAAQPESTASPSSEPARAATAQPASFAGGRYEVRRFLGEGGKKRVFLAHDTRLDRDVAFALIKTEGLDATGRERITREAQAMGRLGAHPHIVTIFEIGDEGGSPYVVNELLGGGDVEGELEKNEGPLPLARTLEIAKGVARGLVFAHERGIVHRDLKPGNVWLTENGTAKIGDFGLAVSLDRSRLTQHGMMVGTVAYMPPEQALGGETTPQADLYSLGAMLYELVTGRPPFQADDPTAIISQHINTSPVAPSWYSEHCPPDLEALILRLLAKVPADRPASATEVLTALEAVDPEARSVSRSDSSANPLDRLARGVFVGRERELERLRSAFDDAFAGHGSVVMLVGEPGIGKTRTSLELETYARMRGGRVIWGRAHEAAGAPPYRPWVQAADTYSTIWGLDAVGPQLTAEDTSELSRIFSGLREQAGYVPPPEIVDPASAQFRLFEAYTKLLRAFASEATLVIMLDDLHWADKPTLLLLQHVAREVGRLRILVVGTYRDTELSRAHPLSETLAELNREGGFQRVNLGGLSQDEVANYIRGTAGLEPSHSLVERVQAETEGNPFFLAEVVNLLAEEGSLDRDSVSDISLPEGVREALGRRLDRLSEAANDVLSFAAVVGRQFAYDTLRLVTGHSDEELLELLEEGLRARVIEEDGRPGRYRFAHALTQETLLSEISATRRVRMHGDVGEALESRWGDRVDEQAARLARHFVASASLNHAHASKAVRYATLAGKQAESQAAWDEAARDYEAALAIPDELGLTALETGGDVSELMVAYGRCKRIAGDPRPGWRRLMEAREFYRARDDASGFAHATLEAQGFLAPPARKAELAREALDLLARDPDERLEAPLLARLADSSDDEAEVDGALARARDLAGRHGLKAVQARLYWIEARVSRRTGGFYSSGPLMAKAHDAFDEIGDYESAGYSSLQWANMSAFTGHLDEGLEAYRAGVEYTGRLRLVTPERGMRAYGASIAIARDDTAALQVALSRLEDLPGNKIYVHHIRATMAELEGDLNQAAALRPKDELTGGLPLYRAMVEGMAARLAYALGEPGAEEALNTWAEMIEPVSSAFLSIAEPDEALLRLGDESLIERTLRALTGSLHEIRLLEGGRTTDQFTGRLALRLDLVEEAERHFLRGVEWCRQERCFVGLGQNYQGLADVAERRGDHALAMQHLDAAGELFSRHGAKLYLDQVLAKKEILRA